MEAEKIAEDRLHLNVGDGGGKWLGKISPYIVLICTQQPDRRDLNGYEPV